MDKSRAKRKVSNLWWTSRQADCQLHQDVREGRRETKGILLLDNIFFCVRWSREEGSFACACAGDVKGVSLKSFQDVWKRLKILQGEDISLVGALSCAMLLWVILWEPWTHAQFQFSSVWRKDDLLIWIAKYFLNMQNFWKKKKLQTFFTQFYFYCQHLMRSVQSEAYFTVNCLLS